MSKNKKKNRIPASVQEAQLRNHYLDRVQKLCTYFGEPTIISELNLLERQLIFCMRGTAFKLKPADGVKLQKDDYFHFQEYINETFKQRFVKFLTPCDLQLSIEDYYQVFLPFQSRLESIKDNEFSKAKEFKQNLARLANLEIDEEQLNQEFIMVLNRISTLLNFFTLNYYWLEFKPKIFSINHLNTENILEIHSAEPETKMVVKNKIPRQTYRVGWANARRGMFWVTMNLSDFRKDNRSMDTQLNVYIQMHALDRLFERLDCLEYYEITNSMVASIMEPVITKLPKGKFLIEYSLLKSKLGYFVVEIIKDIVLIDTFLFLTNSGTPEGNKLKQLTGLSKYDTAYFQINNLEAFVYSDIMWNTELVEIFTNVGCSSIFEIAKRIKNREIEEYEIQSKSAVILKYLNLNKEYKRSLEECDYKSLAS